MKKNLARAATVVGLVVGMGAIAAPSATADVIFVMASGPGDAVVSQVKGSDHVAQKPNDKSVTTGDVKTRVKGPMQNGSLAIEVEGAEQDQGDES